MAVENGKSGRMGVVVLLIGSHVVGCQSGAPGSDVSSQGAATKDSTTCGNGVVDVGEDCDGDCSSICQLDDPCFTMSIEACRCMARHAPGPAVAGDECCPPDATVDTDSDCRRVEKVILETPECCGDLGQLVSIQPSWVVEERMHAILAVVCPPENCGPLGPRSVPMFYHVPALVELQAGSPVRKQVPAALGCIHGFSSEIMAPRSGLRCRAAVWGSSPCDPMPVTSVSSCNGQAVRVNVFGADGDRAYGLQHETLTAWSVLRTDDGPRIGQQVWSLQIPCEAVIRLAMIDPDGALLAYVGISVGQSSECAVGNFWRFGDRGEVVEEVQRGQLPMPQLPGDLQSLEIFMANRAVYGVRYFYNLGGVWMAALGLVDRTTLELMALLAPSGPWQAVLAEDSVVMLVEHAVVKWGLDGSLVWKTDLGIAPGSGSEESQDVEPSNDQKIVLGDRGTVFVADRGVHAVSPNGQLVWSWGTRSPVHALAFSPRGLLAMSGREVSLLDTGAERMARDGWPWKAPNGRGNRNYADRW